MLIVLSIIGLVAASVWRGASPAASIRIYPTFYGWYDNTPPGCAAAYSRCAGGTGTYQHPITFASDKHEFAVGTILYDPAVEKYLRMGDDCQECDEDWSGKGPDGGPRFRHVDIWIGGKGGNEFDVINCEDALTPGIADGAPMLTRFLLNPPPNLPVSTEPLFSSRTNRCFGGAATSTSYGRYRNVRSGTCLQDPGDSTTSGTPAELGPCDASAAAQRIAFDGAFLVVNNLCLQTQSGRLGAAIRFTTCDGDIRQQWAINPNGTISWIQYARCVADVSGKVELARCTTAAISRWDFMS